MATQTFTPHPQHKLKMRLVMTIIACLIMIGMGLLAIPISLEHNGLRTAAILLAVTLGLNLLWWIPAMILVEPYYRSLSYEIQDDQVVMRVGLVTKSVKHVPYRTVTNVTVKQDLIDRMLGLGRLEIQTAGISGTNTAEQSLAGL
ncbi:MAG: PH domain-containing protein, partial [Anaerolineae bacterium]